MRKLNLETLLMEKFNYNSFRQGQRGIIEDVLKGNNVIALLPTGGGKSICYQLPTYLLEGCTLIISPLVSLMEDQVEQLRQLGEKKVVALNSFLNEKNRQEILFNLPSYKFIFVSPEILQSEYIIQKLKRLRISLFVVDEAHCISQWGHDFRLDYSRLGEVRQLLGMPKCLALTATATHEVLSDIKKSLGLNDPKEHIYSVDRPNIVYSIEEVLSIEDKKEKVLHYIKNLAGPGIIYFSSRVWAERITAYLLEQGVHSVAYYHGGVEQEQRILVQQQFIHNQLDIICCTNAFGMGINKPNIRFIIHFHLPSQMEAYLQEVGRAGRDGKESIAILLYSPFDNELPESLLRGDFPLEEQINAVLSELNYLLEIKIKLTLSREEEERLMSVFGLQETQWRFIRFYLQQANYIKKDVLVKKIDVREMGELLNVRIESRIANKQKKLAYMKHWVADANCRRKGILHYFNEQYTKANSSCCDRCGFDILKYFKDADDVPTVIDFNNWRKELASMLLISE